MKRTIILAATILALAGCDRIGRVLAPDPGEPVIVECMADEALVCSRLHFTSMGAATCIAWRDCP